MFPFSILESTHPGGRDFVAVRQLEMAVLTSFVDMFFCFIYTTFNILLLLSDYSVPGPAAAFTSFLTYIWNFAEGYSVLWNGKHVDATL